MKKRSVKKTEEKKKRKSVRKKNGVPVDPEQCLSEASDIMCRATYRAIKGACETDGGESSAKSLKEYWSVLKEALSVTGNIRDENGDENVIRVIMDEAADRYSE